jgi:shikimate kinase
MKNIVLIGMPGSGKTTFAKILAQRLQRPFVDMDTYIVEKYDRSIPSMFDISESYFREREAICCQEIMQQEGQIVSTGGGIIKNIKNSNLLHEQGLVIYLDRPIKDIMQDVEVSTRPLLKDGAKVLYSLYQERHQTYLTTCHIHVVNNRSTEEIIQKIITKIKKLEGNG